MGRGAKTPTLSSSNRVTESFALQVRHPPLDSIVAFRVLEAVQAHGGVGSSTVRISDKTPAFAGPIESLSS